MSCHDDTELSQLLSIVIGVLYKWKVLDRLNSYNSFRSCVHCVGCILYTGITGGTVLNSQMDLSEDLVRWKCYIYMRMLNVVKLVIKLKICEKL